MANKKNTTPEEVKEINFPEDSGQIITRLLEQYGLQKSQEEGINKFIELIKSKTTIGRSEIFDNLPGTKISKLLQECARGKITLEKLPNLLESNLGISEKDAQRLTSDLKDKILNRIKPAEKEKTEPIPTPAPIIKEKKHPRRPDTYREPII